MSLRTRLIIAFLLLSVVPLTAVTLFSYASSVNAVENAARREATEGAADISRRMELITADVGRRMDRIFEFEAPTPATAATAGKMQDRVAPALGDAAVLVDKVEFEPTEDPNPDPNVPLPPGPAPPPKPRSGDTGPVSPKPRSGEGGGKVVV